MEHEPPLAPLVGPPPPWWKQPWVILVLAGLVVLVIICVICSITLIVPGMTPGPGLT